MKRVIPLAEIGENDRPKVGGKAFALARLRTAGFRVPEAVCITTAAYRDFVTAHGLETSIRMELGRKQFADMRWEELWDAALRIRNLFLTRKLPPALALELSKALAGFDRRPVAVRSSAPEEDAAQASFAGLHESYVNIRGAASILDHVQRVWASLWSDAALLYRQEIGLSVEGSAMAVIVQELVPGEASGVAFSMSPEHRDQLMIEAVHGLNQGLVDGTVAPDRWLLGRADLAVIAHIPLKRQSYLVSGPEGVSLRQLPGRLAALPPLTEEQVLAVARAVLSLEQLFSSPQDMEWTMRQGDLHLLQARPITTQPGAGGRDDQRPWYLSLRRSFANLQALRRKIETQLLPALLSEGEALARRPTAALTDAELAAEIERRLAIYRKWHDIYWADFIPFAHGMRLFGQVYNDVMRPADPHEFVVLLTGTPLLSMARNELLQQLAARIRAHPALERHLRGQGEEIEDPEFGRLLATFTARFSDLLCAADEEGAVSCSRALLRLILELVRHPEADHRRRPAEAAKLEQLFLQQLPDAEARRQASEMLELARASYRLRDDDNIHLGRLEAQVEKALAEARRRLQKRFPWSAHLEANELAAALRDPAFRPAPGRSTAACPAAPARLKARQLVGQPAGPGLAQGPARVVAQRTDLAAFRQGEILVCDAMDPTMTFVVPLAAGIVERRGGMLIHGAIIAREYGIACVTGVPEVFSFIRTGDPVTVDGFLGIVTLG